MPQITEREVLDIKKRVESVRDTIIRAKATKHEVEKNLAVIASDLTDLGIVVKAPGESASDEEWNGYYEKLITEVNDAIFAIDQDIDQSAKELRGKIADWGF